MALVCPACGDFNAPVVQRDPDSVRCPACGHAEPMAFLPLFIVTGPSGAGKTAVIGELRKLLPVWEVFETDILWDSGGDWTMTKCNWLRIAHGIAQGGRGTVLCGTILPEQIGECSHLPYFSRIHYLALVSDDEMLIERLKARPAWRESTEDFIAGQLKLNHWLRENAAAFDPPLVLVDTTSLTVGETADQIAEWAQDRWRNEAPA